MLKKKKGDAPYQVLLIAMPFASLHHPNLGLSLLKSSAIKAGAECNIRYFYLEYAEFVGLPSYSVLTDDRYFTAFLGEWLFASLVHGEDLNRDLGYIAEILQGKFGEYFPLSRIQIALEARSRAGEFIDYCMNTYSWGDIDLVGFTTSFQQTMASCALAKRIKSQYPEITIIFGGANCEGEMGVELHRKYEFIDLVCSGEAELSFPEILKRKMTGVQCHKIPSVTWRECGETIPPERPVWPIEQMDDVPWVDYSDFYDQRNLVESVKDNVSAVPLFESARGCWWGERKHCTFCGLNGSTMAFRKKSPDRAFQELSSIVERYGSEVLAVDNILDLTYFSTLLPRLEQAALPLLMHYEVKVNLSPEQLGLLSRIGIRKIQPGVETLDSEILSLMRKGSTMIQNVQTLKLAAEHGIFVEWGFLYGFPGESEDQYTQMASLIPKLTHLHPPVGFTRVRADRFSPYHSHPKEFGVINHPSPAYAYIYPFDREAIGRLAYHYEMSSQELLRAEEYTKPAREAIVKWHRDHKKCELYSLDQGEEIVVVDGRGIREPRTLVLKDLEARIFRFCWRIRTRKAIKDSLGQDVTDIDSLLLSLEEKGLLIREVGKRDTEKQPLKGKSWLGLEQVKAGCVSDRFLALALRQPGWRRAPNALEIKTQPFPAFFRQCNVDDFGYIGSVQP